MSSSFVYLSSLLLLLLWLLLSGVGVYVVAQKQQQASIGLIVDDALLPNSVQFLERAIAEQQQSGAGASSSGSGAQLSAALNGIRL